MAGALEGEAVIPFRIPSGIKLVWVDAKSGLLAMPGAKGVILEAFKPGTEPSLEGRILDGSGFQQAIGATPRAGTGGLY